MRAVERSQPASIPLARRALLTTSVLGIVGSGLGVSSIPQGQVYGPEAVLVISGLVFTLGFLFALLMLRNVAIQTGATIFTSFSVLYLCAGAIIAVAGPGPHLHLFVYLIWFFPLLALNKLVNAPAMGRVFARCLLVAPPLIIACLFFRSMQIFKVDVLMLMGTYCLSYISFGQAFYIATRYREKFIVERERAGSLKAESDLLESISDCFISLDSELRLVYLNEAAGVEFGIEREAALKETIASAVPGFLSSAMQAALEIAAGKTAASVFEAQNEMLDRWYEMRCFPRPDGMSVYFRNITESVSSRRKLDEAHIGLREQAELLDKAQDGILVLDLNGRIVYWNKGAERLYGWTAAEAAGRPVQDGFRDVHEERTNAFALTLQNGEWDGELSQRRRDGSKMIVESRCTLVRAEDGSPRSVLIISTDITNRKAAEARLEHLAFYDALTELPNRSLLRERLQKALAASADEGTMGALLFIDLDDFKTPNASLGHDTGDMLLRQTAARLASCVRKGDTVARLGGDEFVVMLQGLSGDPNAAAAEVTAIGDEIRAASLRPYQVGSYEYNGSVSVGITLFGGHPDSVDELLKRGELALHQAKAKGRSAMRFFDPSMQAYIDSRTALESDLRSALQNQQFELHYQPQVDRVGQAVGAEALLRWRHPVRGMVPPDEFIPLAEESGLIIELGRWVLETACSQLANWASQPAMEKLTIAVNVSLRQFLATDFVNLVVEVLRESGANPLRLKLEITESSVMLNADETIAKMTALKEQSVGFAIDDFGTGYSSLSHLKRLPLDVLKVDRSFVGDMLVDDKNASIVRTIITLGRNLHLAVIGEGVETEAQRKFLEKAGCNVYQGFLYSKALPAQQFEAFVKAGPPLKKDVAAA